ncbi:hypothetical protein XENOCAPTIV_013772 [Xenoophorus captivus]|uniref:RRM domain-containing protein n=1 Tax=Xenoophorus captivus TaxID=1517983 RepID=A0ABV0RH96_9TELE
MSAKHPEERTVEVLEPPGGVDEELLSLYFENKRRSGGGPLESVEIKHNRVVLVFEEAEAAARVLSKRHHVVHNSELSVRKPPSKDRCRLLLRGISPHTSTEMIELYVENMMDLNITDYTLIPSPESNFFLIHLRRPLSKGQISVHFCNYLEEVSVYHLGLIDDVYRNHVYKPTTVIEIALLKI